MSSLYSFSLNWKEIDKILFEIRLENCYIRKITQPDFSFLVFDLYGNQGRKKLLISMKHGKCRIHLLSSPIEKNKIQLQRFAQFLRSRIEGGKILSATQPHGERIIRMELKRGDELTILWIRLWNNSPNVIATDSRGTILDCFTRRPLKEEQSGKRFFPHWEENEPKEHFSLRTFDDQNYPGIPVDLIQQECPYWKKIEWLANQVEQKEAFDVKKRQANALCQKMIDHLNLKIATLQEKLQKAENADHYKLQGELLLYQQASIPKGAKSFQAIDYQTDNLIEIVLDSKISIQQNSERYFKKYKKAKASLEYLHEELNQSQKKIKRFQNELIWIAQTEDEKLLLQWLNENHAYGILSKEDGSSSKEQLKKNLKMKTPPPGLSFLYKGFLLLVGRNGKENDELLRKWVRGNDLWIHTRDYAGGYVFIKTLPGKTVPLEILLAGGNLAIHYSKAKNAGEADLYTTQVKYLRRAKEGPIGLVLPTQEKNLHVKVDSQLLNQLLEEK